MMMKTALATTASVSAICSPTRIAPVLLRSMALSMGRSSMMDDLRGEYGAGLLRLELTGRLDRAHPPGRIQAGDDAREHRDAERDQHHREVEARQLVVVLV